MWKDEHMCQPEKNENRATIIDTVKILVVVEVWLQCVHQLAWHLVNFVDNKHRLRAFGYLAFNEISEVIL